jgi:hypothetical protein
MTEQLTIKERSDRVEAGLTQLLIDNNLSMQELIDFPQYKIIPDEAKLAEMILNKCGAKIVRLYQIADPSKEPMEEKPSENA